MEPLQAQRRVDGFFEDQFRGLLCNRFNVHAPLWRVHDDVAAVCPVEQYAHVNFFRLAVTGAVHVLCDQHLVDLLPLGIGLRCDQMATENARSFSFYLIQPLGQNNAV